MAGAFVLDTVVKAIGGPEVERMRNYVLQHERHPHPEVQQSVEDVYQHLTALASGRMTPKPKMMDAQQLDEMRAQAQMPRPGEPMQSVPASIDPSMRQTMMGDDDEKGATPMQKAMRALVDSHFAKALPEQQMFAERTRRETLSGADDEDFAQENLPEIDRFGARSYGTVHPAILGMLQRRTDDYYENLGINPNLNLDSGQEQDRRIEESRRFYRDLLEQDARPHHLEGMSIAQGPLFNRRRYDSGGDFFGNTNSEEIAHNPDRAARGGPFDSSRFINSYPEEYRRNMSGYGLQPSHKITHPTREEMRG